MEQQEIAIPRSQPRSPLQERCPKCGAQPGERCTVANSDEWASTEHAARKRLAVFKPLAKEDER